MKKQNPWFMILVVVLTLAVLACTCTSSIPNIGSDSGDSGSGSGNSSSSGNSGSSSDSGSSSNSGSSNSGSSDSGSGGGGSARMVRGLPIMDDASNQFDVEAMGTTTVSYSTKNSIRDVVDFYKKEIGAMGYTVLAEATQESSNTAGLTFESSDRLIVVGIAPDPLSAGSLTVSVSSTPK